MATEELYRWMWAKACTTLEKAEQARRRVLEPGDVPRVGHGWEPPVDIFDTGESLWLVVALPGVSLVDVAFDAETSTLRVSGERRLPPQVRHAAIHRLELPHGRFTRRISLPCRPWRLLHKKLTDGCLVLNFSVSDVMESIEK